MAAVRPLAILCVGLLLAAARPAFAFHTLFHFQVDRFEADGNVFGPWDGVPDFVDDFAGDSYAPNWLHLYGTVAVSDGLLNLQNPGQHFSVGFPVDVSEVWSDAVVSIPMGGVTLTSYWVAPTLTPGSSMHMTLALTGTDGHDEFIGLHVQNTSGDGPAVGLHFLELAGDWQPLQVESVPYDQTATSDRIALRLVLDGGMVTGSFSLDGGATFTSPFTPGVVLPHMVSGRLMLGADPITPLPPSCGNGVVEAGEACDLGRRQNGKGCCTDACTLVDRDGDGVCDPRDDCPDVADPKQADGDGDGLGDACDPCTAATDGQSRWSRPLVAVAGLNDDHPGNESLRVSGSFAFSTPGMALDPVTTGARLALRSGKDGSTVTVDLPAGPYVAPGPGWLADDTGAKFVFLDRRRVTAGVRRMRVRRTADGRVRVAVSAPHGAFNFGAWSFPPIHAAIAFGDTKDECGEIRFDDRACAYPQSRRIVCR